MAEFMWHLGCLNECWFACHGLDAIRAQERLAAYVESYIHGASA